MIKNYVCSTCRTTLPEEDFYYLPYITKEGKLSGHRQKACKSCRRSYTRNVYHTAKKNNHIKEEREKIYSFNGDDAIYC